jgi:hypothetical protein
VIADAFTQLVFHALAHARLHGPGNIYDPRYLAWAAERFAERDAQVLGADAALLARLWAADPRYDRLHRYCELHRDWAGFLASADRSLAELHPTDVGDARLLASIRELDGAELLHATLALIGPSFARVLAELRPVLERAAIEVRGWIDRLTVPCPGLVDARVELVWALGMHGRGFTSRILVGAPANWNACSPARQAVLAAHEHTVSSIAQGDYVADEWAALTELSLLLRDAERELREAHRAWLASLELAPLIHAAVARGYLDASEADSLIRQPAERATRLSAARAAASR